MIVNLSVRLPILGYFATPCHSLPLPSQRGALQQKSQSSEACYTRSIMEKTPKTMKIEHLK